MIEGDGRLQLEASPDRFGLLVLDAFGSDAIPLHLLTRQALEIYLQRLRPGGLLAFHISNKYLDLEPVLANLARDAVPRMACYVRTDQVLTDEERAAGKFPSVWLVLAQRAEDVPAPLRTLLWRPAQARADLRDWTDSYSNVWQVFRWEGSGER